MKKRPMGFTLIEVLLVLVILGILAGLALPGVSVAIAKGDAAKVVSDARNIKVALRSYLESGGTLPRSRRWGQAPQGLEDHLPENMTFTHNTLDYRLTTQRRIGAAQLRVRYPRQSPIGEALKAHRRSGEVTWRAGRTTFFPVK